MANRTIVGGAAKIAQISTVVIGSNTNTHTFILSVRHPSGSSSEYATILTVTADGALTTTQLAAAVAAAWNASGHIHTMGITAASSVATVTLTADKPGVPFLVKTTGTGTTTPASGSVLTDSTANCGPWGYTAENTAEGILAANDDEAWLTGNYDLLYVLDQSAVTVDAWTRMNHFGRVGWPGMPLRIAPSTGDRFVHDNPGGGVAYIALGSANFNPEIINAGHIWPYALYLTGGNASAEWTVHAGNCSFGTIDGDVCTIGTLINLGANIEIGPRAVVTNYRQAGGSCKDYQIAARTLVQLDGGTYMEQLAGTLGTFNNNGADAMMLGLGDISGGTIIDGYSDFESTQQARSVTLSYVSGKAAFSTLLTGTRTRLGKEGPGLGG